MFFHHFQIKLTRAWMIGWLKFDHHNLSVYYSQVGVPMDGLLVSMPTKTFGHAVSISCNDMFESSSFS
ncbi:MAG: hypothetical protein Ct9H300mP9_5840 [Candidatus Neomarinimicrobiota bacterium]|nr:MAG: hypothetical protein Ct9H300mP9_5840 [Candidatus Neomarinimicrobiota bacterium]